MNILKKLDCILSNIFAHYIKDSVAVTLRIEEFNVQATLQMDNRDISVVSGACKLSELFRRYQSVHTVGEESHQ